jgi:hypothetical protein
LVSAAAPGTLPALKRFYARRSRRPAMTFGINHLQPIVSLLAGILILIMPRLLNFIVAIYLIVIGIIGLGFFR